MGSAEGWNESRLGFWDEIFGTGICLWLRVVSTNPRLGGSKENIFQVRVSAYVYAGLRFDEVAERETGIERGRERDRYRLGNMGMGDAHNLSVGQTVRPFGHHLLVVLRSSQTTVLAT